jgi:hypothetical protein
VLLLDLLIGTLVGFPLLTEGIFIELPWFSGELSDLGIPILAVALAGLAAATLRRRLRQPPEAGVSARPAMTAGAGGVLWHAGMILGAFVLVVLLSYHWSFESHGFDPRIAIWNATHGTGAVPLVALVAAITRRWSSEPWEKSFFVRQGTRLAHFWLEALDRSPGRMLWSAAGAVGALFLWVALQRHWAFETHGFDMGIFTNALWNLTHGNGYVSSVKGGINLFSDHQSPLLWAFAPLFWMVPRPETLLFAQAFGLAAGGPALYYLARARLGHAHWAPAALPWLYWSYLPLRNANAFDFHPEVFMLPLFLWAFVGFASDLSADSRRDRWRGALLAAAGVALFFFDVKVVPRFFDGAYAYLNLYERFGGGIGDLLLAPFTQPVYFFSQIFNLQRLYFLFWTLAPLGFLPLFCWRAAVAALPPYLMLFLSEGDQRVRLVFHYGIEPGSALFWALPLGLAAFARRFGWKGAGLWMLFWCLASLGQNELVRARGYAQLRQQWLAEVVSCLNQEAPTAASDVLIPHLATRAWISYPYDLRQHPSGEPVRCVVTDLDLSNWPLGRAGVERVLASLPEQGYREVWRCRAFSVFELGASGCLRCVPNCPPVSQFRNR